MAAATRLIVPLLLAFVAGPGCDRGAASLSSESHLVVSGGDFVTPEHHAFSWRGVTAFRLLEYVARGRDREVEDYLSWAQRQRLTVVRVLAMGQGWMNLSPADGRAALPRLLERARAHGLYVEIVALAGTRDAPVNLDEQVTAIGRIAAQFDNALIELANEPGHPTQADEVHKSDVLLRLRTHVPPSVPVALGSMDPGGAAADYVTWHAPRDPRFEGWGHVLALADGFDLLRAWRKPVISDEPIGAGAAYEPGRRDNLPARFRAAALVTRLAGLGATFHYEGGLQAKIPAGRELECFNAWNEAWTLLPADVEGSGTFRRAGEENAAVADYPDRALAVYERQRGSSVWVVIVNPQDDFAMRWRPGWVPAPARRLEGVWLVNARRDARRAFGR